MTGTRRRLLAALGGVVSTSALAGCSTATGGDPATEAGGSTVTSRTEASSEEDGGDGEATGSTTTTADVEFAARVQDIETCRTLTYAVGNEGSDGAPDVTVRIRVSTGGEQVWDETDEVGTIEAGDERSGITRDVDVGLLGGRKIKSNDGEVVVRLTPRSAGVAETFAFERTLDV